MAELDEAELDVTSACEILSPTSLSVVDDDAAMSDEMVDPNTDPADPGDMTAEDLEDSLTATLYIESSGDPDLQRLELETGLIAAQQLSGTFGIEHPLSEDSEYSFVILGGNDQGVFRIDPPTGMISIIPPDPVEPPTGDTVDFDFSEEPWFESESTLIRDLASTCPDRSVIPAGAEELGISPEDVGYSTWEEVNEDPETRAFVEQEIAAILAEANPPEDVIEAAIVAATGSGAPVSTETSNEMAALFVETPEVLQENPELVSALEALNLSPTSTYDLLIGVVSDFDREAARSTNIDEMALSTSPNGTPAPLTHAEILNIVSETPSDKTYTLTINIDNQSGPDAAAGQLPAATAPASTGCSQTMGAFGFAGMGTPPGAGAFGGMPFPADDGFRPQPGPRGQMVLQVAHNEWMKSVTEPGKSARQRVREVIGRDTSWQQLSRYVYEDYSEQGLAKGGGPYDSSPARRSEWCGAFAAFCYGGAGLKKYYRKSVLPSTSRLQSHSRIEAAFEKDYEDIDPSLRPPLPDRRDETLGGRVIWNPAPQQIIPGDILVMGPQPGASNFENDYGKHISVVAEVTETGCFTYEGNGLGWIYGMPETDEFGGDGRRQHGVIRGFCPFVPYAEKISDYAVIYIHRPLEVDYYAAGQAPINPAPNLSVPDTDGRSEEFVGD